MKPEARKQVLEDQRKRVRRKYKTNLKKRKKFITGEEDYVKEMIVVLKIAGYSNSQIGSIVGVSRGQVKLLLSKPDAQELLLVLREKLPEAALALLQSYSIEAVQSIVGVMRSSTDDTVILKAASEVLDRAGLPKMSKSEANIHKTQEYKTTLSDEGIVDRLRQLPPELQEQAAQMVENIEKLLEENSTEVNNGSAEDD